MSRNDESLAEREKAVRLDPLSPIITSELGFAFYYDRNYKRAVEEFRKAVELYPDFSPAHSFLACAYDGSGQYDQAIAECQKAIALADDSYLLTQLARASAHSGNRGSAEKLLAKMVEGSKNRYYPPTLIAMTYAALGHRDEAFEWLYSAYQHRDWALVQLSVAPEFDSLRSDPRFADLMRQMNFSQ
jgi:tetratricopeptide (TPR) repeat protein